MNRKSLTKLFHLLGISWIIMVNVIMLLICYGVLVRGGSVMVVERNVLIVSAELGLAVFGILYAFYLYYKVYRKIGELPP